MKHLLLSFGFTLLFSQTLFSQSNCSGYFIRFPDDHNTSLCVAAFTPDIFGSPQILGNNCDSLSIKYWDMAQEFPISSAGECYEFDRYWTIYNPATYQPTQPCIYVPNPRPVNMILSPANTPGPVLSALGTSLPGWEPTIVKINASDPAATNYSTFWSANANCYLYTQNVKIFDNQDPVVVAASPDSVYFDMTANDAAFWNHPDWLDPNTGDHNLSEGPLDFEIVAIDSCSVYNITFYYRLYMDLDGDSLQETVVNSVNPPGINNIQYGNYNSANFTGGQPHPFDTRLVPQNQKWGFGLQTETLSSNTRKARVRWFNQAGQDTVPQLPYGTHRIKWFVEDGCGNEKIYNMIITNQKGSADSIAAVSGQVLDECSAPFPGIFVGSGPNTTSTDSAGQYLISPVVLNTNLDVCATGDLVPGNYADAVNVCDMVTIQRHILGIASFITPYRMIASDVNNSSSVTDMDILFTRRMLMGFYDEQLIPDPPLKWRFINASTPFPNPANPFSTPIQSCYPIPGIQQSVTNANFIGFKTGDADGSASGCNGPGSPIPFQFFTQGKAYQTGDTITISLSPSVPVSALQVVLEADGLTFWNPFPVNNLNSPTYISDNIAKVTWLDPGTMPGTPAIELQLIAQQNGILSENLHFAADDYTKATVYKDSCTAIVPEMEFITVSAFEPGATQVLHNYPNPWHSQTIIELNAPAAGEGDLQVFDVAGRVLYSTVIQLQQGRNRITLRANDIKNTGPLFCRLMTSAGIYSGVMVRI